MSKCKKEQEREKKEKNRRQKKGEKKRKKKRKERNLPQAMQQVIWYNPHGKPDLLGFKAHTVPL